MSDSTKTTGWQEIREDNLPPLDEIVWLWDGCKIWTGGRADDRDGWLWANTDGYFWFNGSKWDGDLYTDDDYRPTHWMAMPTPPNDPAMPTAIDGRPLT